MPIIIQRRVIRYSREEILEAIAAYIEKTSGGHPADIDKDGRIWITDMIEYDLPDQVVTTPGASQPAATSIAVEADRPAERQPARTDHPVEVNEMIATENPPASPPAANPHGWTDWQKEKLIELKSSGFGDKAASEIIGKPATQIAVKWAYMKKRGQHLPASTPPISAAPPRGVPHAGADLEPAAKPPKEQQIIHLYEQEKLSIETIAERLFLSPVYVDAHVQRHLAERGAIQPSAAVTADWDFSDDNLRVRD